MRPVLTLDRLPVFAMMGVLAISWLGADSYLVEGKGADASPATPVWAAYDPEGAATFVAWAVSGLLLAAFAPLKGSVALRDIAQQTAMTVRRLMPLLVVLAVGGVSFMIFVKGRYLFEAPAYLMFDAPQAAVSLANILAPVTVVAIGVVSTRRPWLSGLLLVAVSIVLFSYATRLFAGVLLLFVVGRLLSGARVLWPTWLLALVFELLTLPVPLLNRNQAAHGLLHYGPATWRAVTEEPYLSRVTDAAAENIGFTVPLLQFVAEKATIPWRSMAISLNPAPSALVGWEQLAPSLRVHYYIPYSMLGEFASFGGPVLLLALLAWGVLVRWSILRMHQVDNPFMPLFLATAVGMSLVTVVYAMQYNTRSVMRVVTLMLALVLVEAAVRWFVLTRRDLLMIPPLPVDRNDRT